MQRVRVKIILLGAMVALTVAIHYGWILENIFGHSPWVHSVHARFCYVPILVGAAWFGLRGGVFTAAAISILIAPYLLGHVEHMASLSEELVEVLFYFGFGALVGILVDRDNAVRRKQEKTQLELERARHLSQVGQMAASVAHEIKNPLASIKGATEIIVDDQTAPADRKEFQEILKREIRRIDGTVQEFLAFARPKETRLESTDFSAVLNASIKQIAPQIAVMGIKLVESVEPGITVRGDAEKLHEVTLNLLLNAAQASKSGSTVSVLARRLNARQLEFIVKDAGAGIDAETMKHVFEPFFTTKSSGTGLGLAIVKSIVDAHRGSISIDSTPAVGTQVRIVLTTLEEHR